MILKQIQIITGSFKTKNSCVSWKMFEIEFKYSKLGPKHCVYVSLSQQNDWLLRVQVTIFVTDNLNKHLPKKMKASICVKKIQIIKFFEIYG